MNVSTLWSENQVLSVVCVDNLLTPTASTYLQGTSQECDVIPSICLEKCNCNSTQNAWCHRWISMPLEWNHIHYLKHSFPPPLLHHGCIVYRLPIVQLSLKIKASDACECRYLQILLQVVHNFNFIMSIAHLTTIMYRSTSNATLANYSHTPTQE